MTFTVTFKVKVDANDGEGALRLAFWRLMRVTPTGIYQDKYPDIDREISTSQH